MKSCILVGVATLLVTYCEMVNGAAEYLPSMKKEELIKIIDCISTSQNQVLCDYYITCMKTFPPQIVRCNDRCNQEINPTQNKRCNKHIDLYPGSYVPSALYECIKGYATLECCRDAYKKCRNLRKNIDDIFPFPVPIENDSKGC